MEEKEIVKPECVGGDELLQALGEYITRVMQDNCVGCAMLKDERTEKFGTGTDDSCGPEPGSTSYDEDEDLTKEERQLLAEEGITSELTRTEKNILLLYTLFGLDFNKIAKVLDIRASTVYVMYCESLRMLYENQGGKCEI